MFRSRPIAWIEMFWTCSDRNPGFFSLMSWGLLTRSKIHQRTSWILCENCIIIEESIREFTKAIFGCRYRPGACDSIRKLLACPANPEHKFCRILCFLCSEDLGHGNGDLVSVEFEPGGCQFVQNGNTRVSKLEGGSTRCAEPSWQVQSWPLHVTCAVLCAVWCGVSFVWSRTCLLT